MPMTFYMTPGSCSTGLHIVLELLELPFQVHVVNLPAGEHRQPAYLAVNPKGTIPALALDDGVVLTEFVAIAYWLARRHPRAALLSSDPLDAARTLALLEHVVGTVHGQGWTRVFTPDTYLPQDLPPSERERWIPAVQARGREIVGQGFDVVEAALRGDGFATGARFSIADAALFYVFFWADKTALPLPPRCQALYERLRALPVVQRVLREEGYR